MPERMQLTDGTDTVTFSPLVSPEYDRTDSRYRGSFKADSGDIQLYDLGGAQRHNLALNDLSKADADQLNLWWRNLTILDYIPKATIGVYADLNGTSQYFYRTDADFPESGILGDLTIEAWIKPDISASGVLVGKWHLTNDKRMYALIYANNELTIYISVDGDAFSQKTTSGMDIVEGTWCHVAVVYDASAGTADFYKNGIFVEQETGLPNSIADKDPDFAIGKWSTLATLFEGCVANVALYNAIVTGADILAAASDWDYDHSGEGNIIGCWKFNDFPGVAFIDNGQGDAGRDLIPYDGGDVAFDNLRGPNSIYARIQGTQAPLQMDFPTGWQGRYEGALTLHEVSSSSSSSGA